MEGVVTGAPRAPRVECGVTTGVSEMSLLKTGKVLFAAAYLAPTLAMAAFSSGVPTCKDVLGAKDMASMETKLAGYRRTAFDAAAKQHASSLMDGLKAKGVNNPLPVVLDEYESRLVPARGGAEMLWTELVSHYGGTKGAFQALCPETSSDLVSFYSTLYDLALSKADEARKATAEFPHELTK